MPGEPGSKEAEEYLWSMPHTCIELTHNHGTEKVQQVAVRLKRDESTASRPIGKHGPLDVPCARSQCHSQDPEFSYDSGNNEPHRGFGHIAIFTDDVYKACDELEKKNVGCFVLAPRGDDDLSPPLTATSHRLPLGLLQEEAR